MDAADLESALKSAVAAAVRREGGPPRWRAPLLAVADAADPLFEEIRAAMLPGYARPGDFLPGARSVLCFFIPFQAFVHASNAAPGPSSEEWARAYIDANALIAGAARDLVEAIAAAGFRAATLPATGVFDRESLTSRWSHRHAAYVAGLGTFGLNNLLITGAGSAGRLGTVFTDLALPPTRRPEAEYCLSKRGLSCRVCVDRCEYGALAPDGFDRRRCYERCLDNQARYARLGKADVCGKCAVALPCSMGAP